MENINIYSNSNCYSYLNHLVNRIYKILPLKESNSPTLDSYLQSLELELKGFKPFNTIIKNDPIVLSVFNILEFIKNEDCPHDVYKKEVFRCINIIQKINKKYFEE